MLGNQKRTSAGTSINKNRIPTAFTKFKPSGIVLDYGCGKYINHIKNYCFNSGCLGYLPYDPYNQPYTLNKPVCDFAYNYGADMIYCCNVLNVIDSNDGIRSVLTTIRDMSHERTKIIIQIYEGNKTGEGQETKKDCFQRNQSTAYYLDFVTQIFSPSAFSIIKMSNYIIIEKR